MKLNVCVFVDNHKSMTIHVAICSPYHNDEPQILSTVGIDFRVYIIPWFSQTPESCCMLVLVKNKVLPFCACYSVIRFKGV